MVTFAFIDESDAEFIRVTTNLLRTFIQEGSVALVGRSESPDFLIASIWREHPFSVEPPIVLISNENWVVFRPYYPLGLYHAVIGIHTPPTDFGRSPNFIQYPFEAVWFDCSMEELFALREELLHAPREKFCCFVSSNATFGEMREVREEVFRSINAWRPVDSAGGEFNNTGYLAPKGLEFLKWISQYRFMACLENSNTPGYITEKALQAWIGGAIPIYDGGTLERLREEAFINASGNYLVEIQALESDPSLYARKQRAELYKERPSLRDFEARFREVFKL